MAPKKNGRPKSDEKIAQELGRPESTVRRWRRRGMPDSGAARKKWVENHTRKQESARKTGDASLGDEKLRQEIEVLKIKKRRQQLLLQKEKGLLVERAAVVREFELFFTDARVRLEAIPSLVAAYVDESERIEVLEEARKEVNAVLSGLAGLGACNG